MQETRSFNLQLINLFVGIFRRHPFVRSLSTEFVNRLQYQLHGVEVSFGTAQGTVNPEAIACSQHTCHTLLVEWTAASTLNYQKQQQIDKYLKVNSHELISANIHAQATRSCSLWLVVPPESLIHFESVVDGTNSHKLLLSSFGKNSFGQHSIDHHLGDIQDADLSNFIRSGVIINRIPLGYIPFPLEDLKDTLFFDSIVQQLVTFILNDKKPFSDESFCSEMIQIWSDLSQDKKAGIKKGVHSFLKKLSRKDYCQGWLEIAAKHPINWKVSSPKGKDIRKFIQKIKEDTDLFTERELS